MLSHVPPNGAPSPSAPGPFSPLPTSAALSFGSQPPCWPRSAAGHASTLQSTLSSTTRVSLSASSPELSHNAPGGCWRRPSSPPSTLSTLSLSQPPSILTPRSSPPATPRTSNACLAQTERSGSSHCDGDDRHIKAIAHRRGG